MYAVKGNHLETVKELLKNDFLKCDQRNMVQLYIVVPGSDSWELATYSVYISPQELFPFPQFYYSSVGIRGVESNMSLEALPSCKCFTHHAVMSIFLPACRMDRTCTTLLRPLTEQWVWLRSWCWLTVLWMLWIAMYAMQFCTFVLQVEFLLV